MIERDRVADYELVRELAPALWVAQRRGERVLLRFADVGAANAFARTWVHELELARRIEHEHLGRVLETAYAAPYLYIAYANVDGARSLGLDVTHADAIAIVRRLCAALHALHVAHDASGRPLEAVHRGVRPRAIVVGTAGQVRLLDFMLASGDLAHAEGFRSRDVFPYLSPEQASGLPLDARTDQYSLAAVLWELTVGERRFLPMLSDYQIIEAIRRDAEPPSSRRADYPRGLERVVMRALAREPLARFPTMLAFSDALAGCTN